jgi:hypothetical protein
MEAACSSETSMTFNGLPGVMSQKVELFVKITVFWEVTAVQTGRSLSVFVVFLNPEDGGARFVRNIITLTKLYGVTPQNTLIFYSAS